MQKTMKHIKNQAGATLLELIAALSVLAIIVVGALALYSSASSSQASTQISQDVTAIRAGLKQLWNGQGTYGTAGTNLNDTLVAAKRIPTTIRVDATTTPDTLTHQLDGTVTIASTGVGFTITLTNIPEDVCIPLMTSAQGWTSVKAGTATAITSFPIAPASAVTACATGTTLVFTGS